MDIPSFEPTYKELKQGSTGKLLGALGSFEPTYKELKLSVTKEELEELGKF